MFLEIEVEFEFEFEIEVGIGIGIGVEFEFKFAKLNFLNVVRNSHRCPIPNPKWDSKRPSRRSGWETSGENMFSRLPGASPDNAALPARAIPPHPLDTFQVADAPTPARFSDRASATLGLNTLGG